MHGFGDLRQTKILLQILIAHLRDAVILFLSKEAENVVVSPYFDRFEHETPFQLILLLYFKKLKPKMTLYHERSMILRIAHVHIGISPSW